MNETAADAVPFLVIQRRALQGVFKLAKRTCVDTSRPHLNQVRIEPTDVGSRWVFTNGHVMYVWAFEGWIPTESLHVDASDMDILIAALKGTLRETEASITNGCNREGSHWLDLNSARVRVFSDADRVESSGQFPGNWARTVPAEGGKAESEPVGVDPGYVADVMEAIGRMPDGRRPVVKLTVRGALHPVRIDATSCAMAVDGSTELPNTRVTMIAVIMPIRL